MTVVPRRRTYKLLNKYIQQDNMFESREQKPKEVTYSVRLPGQFEDEEAMYEVNIPTDTEEL